MCGGGYDTPTIVSHLVSDPAPGHQGLARRGAYECRRSVGGALNDRPAFLPLWRAQQVGFDLKLLVGKGRDVVVDRTNVSAQRFRRDWVPGAAAGVGGADGPAILTVHHSYTSVRLPIGCVCAPWERTRGIVNPRQPTGGLEMLLQQLRWGPRTGAAQPAADGAV